MWFKQLIVIHILSTSGRLYIHKPQISPKERHHLRFFVPHEQWPKRQTFPTSFSKVREGCNRLRVNSALLRYWSCMCLVSKWGSINKHWDLTCWTSLTMFNWSMCLTNKHGFLLGDGCVSKWFNVSFQTISMAMKRKGKWPSSLFSMG